MTDSIAEIRENTLELLSELPGIKTFDEHFTKADYYNLVQLGLNPKVIKLQEQENSAAFYLSGQTVYLEQTIKFKIWLIPVLGRYIHYQILLIPEVLQWPLKINNLKEIVQENMPIFTTLVAYMWRMNSEIMNIVSLEREQEQDLLNLKLTATEIRQVLKPGHMFNSEINDQNFISNMSKTTHPEMALIKHLISWWYEINQQNALIPVIKVNVAQIIKNLFTEYSSDRIDLALGDFKDLKVNFKPMYLKTDTDGISADLYDEKANNISHCFYDTNTFKLVKELYHRPEINFSFAECKLDYATDILTIKVLKPKLTWIDKIHYFIFILQD